jgi:F0F1-type ATP synthase membrane subunit b/b'
VEDQDVLHHLLKVESQAAALASDAQTEADKRILEADKEGRAVYEAGYAEAQTEREAAYKEAMAAVRNSYQAELQAYRKKMDELKMDKNAFFSLADAMLFSSVGG